MRRHLACCMLLGLLAGCGMSPDPNYYTLSAVPGTPSPSTGHVIEVRRPGLAGYLDRSDIVLNHASYRLQVTSADRWAEPLADMIGRVLTENLSQRLPGDQIFGEAGAITASPDLRVEVDLQRFDAANGQAVLIAQSAIEQMPGHHLVSSRHISLTAPAGTGAGGLAAAMSSLLGQLSDQIEAQVAGVSAAGS